MESFCWHNQCLWSLLQSTLQTTRKLGLIQQCSGLWRLRHNLSSSFSGVCEGFRRNYAQVIILTGYTTLSEFLPPFLYLDWKLPLSPLNVFYSLLCVNGSNYTPYCQVMMGTARHFCLSRTHLETIKVRKVGRSL